MYKMNLYLKMILTLLSIIITIITGNYIILWILLVCLTFLNYRKDRHLLIIDLILIISLAISSRIGDFLILYKLLFIVSIIVTFIYFLTKEENKQLKLLFGKDSNNSTRDSFYNKYYNSILESNRKKVIDKYGDISFDEKVNNDLERKYLQSRIRFNGFVNKNIYDRIKWNRIDIMILILAILLFCIMIIFR